MTKNKSVPLYGHTCGHQNLEIWCWQIQNCKDVNVIVNVRFQTLCTEFEYQVNALVTILKSSGYIEFCSICCFFFVLEWWPWRGEWEQSVWNSWLQGWWLYRPCPQGHGTCLWWPAQGLTGRSAFLGSFHILGR